MSDDSKIPTLEEKSYQFRMFIHSLSVYRKDEVKISRLLNNAHEYSVLCDRIGGESGLEKEQKIARAFWKLCDTD
jgi:hypothetical protein